MYGTRRVDEIDDMRIVLVLGEVQRKQILVQTHGVVVSIIREMKDGCYKKVE